MWLEDIFKGGAEGLLKGFKDAVGAFKADPTKVAELELEAKKLEGDLIVKLAQADTVVIQAVNASMQAESKAEHWMQWSWRPLFGYTGAAVIMNNYILLPYLVPLGIVPIVVPEAVWLMIMAILGVAAWTRGQAQIETIRKGN